jgi:hypothetical protein
MTVLERVNQMKQSAIELLLNERGQIDQELNALGYGQKEAPAKRRGRPAKARESSQPSPLCNSESTPL